MNRGEAAQLLREISIDCAGSLSLSYVTLNETNSGSYRLSSDSYQLQIGAALNDTSQNGLMPLLVKRRTVDEGVERLIACKSL